MNVECGCVSAGKTTLIRDLVGHKYEGGVIAEEPATESFHCIVFGANKREDMGDMNHPLYSQCSILENTRKHLAATNPPCVHMAQDPETKLMFPQPGTPLQHNALRVADDNQEFADFIFLDTPGYEHDFIDKCEWSGFFEEYARQADHLFFLWTFQRLGSAHVHKGVQRVLTSAGMTLGKKWTIVQTLVGKPGDPVEKAKQQLITDIASLTTVAGAPKFNDLNLVSIDWHETNMTSPADLAKLKTRLQAVKAHVQTDRYMVLRTGMLQFLNGNARSKLDLLIMWRLATARLHSWQLDNPGLHSEDKPLYIVAWGLGPESCLVFCGILALGIVVASVWGIRRCPIQARAGVSPKDD
jgi:hypothetical protein